VTQPQSPGFSSVIDNTAALRTNLILIGATYRFDDAVLP